MGQEQLHFIDVDAFAFSKHHTSHSPTLLI